MPTLSTHATATTTTTTAATTITITATTNQPPSTAATTTTTATRTTTDHNSHHFRYFRYCHLSPYCRPPHQVLDGVTGLPQHVVAGRDVEALIALLNETTDLAVLMQVRWEWEWEREWERE